MPTEVVMQTVKIGQPMPYTCPSCFGWGFVHHEGALRGCTDENVLYERAPCFACQGTGIIWRVYGIDGDRVIEKVRPKAMPVEITIEEAINENRLVTQIEIMRNFVENLLNNSKDLDPKISELVSRYFWDLSEQ